MQHHSLISNNFCVPRAIEPFQKGETPYFIEHIKVGLELLSAEPGGMLVLSG